MKKPLFVLNKSRGDHLVRVQKAFKQPGKRWPRTTFNMGPRVDLADQLAAELNAAVEWYVAKRVEAMAKRKECDK